MLYDIAKIENWQMFVNLETKEKEICFNVAFANDLKGMTLEEKDEWVSNNVTPEYYEGIKEESEEGVMYLKQAPLW